MSAVRENRISSEDDPRVTHFSILSKPYQLNSLINIQYTWNRICVFLLWCHFDFCFFMHEPFLVLVTNKWDSKHILGVKLSSQWKTEQVWWVYVSNTIIKSSLLFINKSLLQLLVDGCDLAQVRHFAWDSPIAFLMWTILSNIYLVFLCSPNTACKDFCFISLNTIFHMFLVYFLLFLL